MAHRRAIHGHLRCKSLHGSHKSLNKILIELRLQQHTGDELVACHFATLELEGKQASPHHRANY